MACRGGSGRALRRSTGDRGWRCDLRGVRLLGPERGHLGSTRTGWWRHQFDTPIIGRDGRLGADAATGGPGHTTRGRPGYFWDVPMSRAPPRVCPVTGRFTALELGSPG